MCAWTSGCDFWIWLGPNGRVPNDCYIKQYIGSEKSIGDVTGPVVAGAIGGARGCVLPKEAIDKWAKADGASSGKHSKTVNGKSKGFRAGLFGLAALGLVLFAVLICICLPGRASR